MNDEQHKRIKGTIIIIVGILLLLYPLFTDLYTSTLQDNRWTKYRKGELDQNVQQGLDALSANSQQETTEFTEALLKIPAINLSAVVAKGTSEEILNTSLGWYEESALPGQGNTAIAGHRSMYGGIFRDLAKLKPGDMVYLEFNGYVYRYRVAKLHKVETTDWSCIEDCGYTALTLTTCVKGDAEHRQVVRAVFCDKEVKG
ncbi:MAG TPA: class E sortase [Peptococcaceae bacterium]|nr:class E sortase [Peptococcaceae bacterium]HPZ70638.1 class E sortase [Peptococcaceae bacterium]HQD54249.1 class E sortase [Peptococcaceae bacterium]